MNTKNTAVKRIAADVKEIARHPTWRYHAAPLDNDIFEWHFTIRGPSGSDFDGGIYHGRILLSSEYPFKPPNIIFLTKNGRFEVDTKICLSISAYHPEHWQPAWGVRTMLEAIVSFLPSEGNGAIGALDWTPQERQKLATESHQYRCPHCGPIGSLIPTPLPDPSQQHQDQDQDQEKAGQGQGQGQAEGEGDDGADMAARIAQMHVHGLGASTPSSSPVKATGKSVVTPSPTPYVTPSAGATGRSGGSSGASTSGRSTSGTSSTNESSGSRRVSAEFDPARIAAMMPDDPMALREWLKAGNGVECVSGERKDFLELQRRQLRDDDEEEARELAGSWTDAIIFYALLLLCGLIAYLLMKRYRLYTSQDYNQFAYRDL